MRGAWLARWGLAERGLADFAGWDLAVWDLADVADGTERDWLRADMGYPPGPRGGAAWRCAWGARCGGGFCARAAARWIRREKQKTGAAQAGDGRM